jgi:hypothetical protein
MFWVQILCLICVLQIFFLVFVLSIYYMFSLRAYILILRK